MSTPPVRVALVAVSAGGALGALARYGVTETWPVGDGFPWTVFTVNVVGSGLLALLPALGVVRRTPWLGLFLGTGVLGGFTTMSAASVETVTLLDRGDRLTALGYAGGTLLAALAAVALVSRWTTPQERADADASGADL